MAKDSLIKGTIILAAAAFIARALGLLQKVPLQHILGDEGMAHYGIAYNVYGMLLIVAAAGIPSALSKLISERYAIGKYGEARRIYRAAVYFALATGCISAALLYAAAPFYAEHIAHNEKAALSIRAIAPALLVFPLIAIMRGYYQGRQMMMAGGMSQIMEQILRVGTAVALAFALYSMGYADETIAAGASFGAVAGAAAAFAVMLYYERRTYAADQREGLIRNEQWQEQQETPMTYRRIYGMLLRVSIPISLISLAVPMMYFIDSSIVIGLLQDDIGKVKATEALGIITGKAQSLSGIPPILAIALSMSVLPVISAAYAKQNHAEVAAKSSQALRIALITGMPVVIVLAVAAEPLIGFLFSDAVGWQIASVLTVSSLFQIMMMTSSAILMGLGRIRAPMIHVFIGIIVKLAGSYALSPFLGVYGIVGATLCGFAVIMVLNMIVLRTLVRYRVLGSRWAGFALTTVVLSGLGIVVAWLMSGLFVWNDLVSNLIKLAVIGSVLMAAYPACLFGFRTITEDDLKLFPARLRALLVPFMKWTGIRKPDRGG